jgi:signal transduction histidine kinase
LSLGLFLIEHKRKQKKNRLEKQQLEFDYKNDLLRTRLEEQDKSMTLISEEIHDNIGQVLGLAKMYLHNLISHVHTKEGRSYGAMAEDLLSTALNDLRHISHSLNSELLQKSGLDNSLEREVTFLQETTEICCSFNVTGLPYKLEKEKNVLIFRVVQETLQNAVKHSEAKNLELLLHYGAEDLTITVKDDGKGFDIDSARENNSLGLRNIHNRADLLRARLKIETHPGSGTTLVLSVPNNQVNL